MTTRVSFLIRKKIFQIVLFLVDFDYYGYIMIYYLLIRIFLDIRPSSMEEIMNWPYFPNPRLGIDFEFVSDDAVDLVLVLIILIWCY